MRKILLYHNTIYMPSYRKHSQKRSVHKRLRRSSRAKRGGDEPNNDDWDVEMGPRSESPVQQIADNEANDMESGVTKFSPQPSTPGEEMLGGKGKRKGHKSKKHHKKGKKSKTRKGKKHSRRSKK
jgi:hypothetical protein